MCAGAAMQARDILATVFFHSITPITLEGNLMAEIPTPTTGYSAPARSRPLGVTILAILLILGAVLNLIGTPANFLVYGLLFGGYYVLMAVVNLIIGIALFQMIPWSRTAAIIMQLIGLILGLVLSFAIGSLLGGLFISLMLISMVPSIIISLIVIIYLMQGSIKAAFEGSQW